MCYNQYVESTQDMERNEIGCWQGQILHVRHVRFVLRVVAELKGFSLCCVLKESLWQMLLKGRMEAGRLLQSCRRGGGSGWRQQMEKKGRICIEKHMGGKINWAKYLPDGEGEGVVRMNG